MAMGVRASGFGGTADNRETFRHGGGGARLRGEREWEQWAAVQGFEGQRKALEQGENEAEVEVEADRAVQDATDYIQMCGVTLEV